MNTTNASGNSTVLRYTYELYSSNAKIVGYSIAYGLISCVGLMGHIMVFMVIAMNRTMHTATNLLLVNLSLADILFITLTVPGLLMLEICNDRWLSGQWMAKATLMVNISCAASSVFTMMVIALERYIAVVHPLKHMARKKSKWTIVIVIVLIWCCSIALSIPLGVYTVLWHFVVAVLKDGVLTGEQEEIAIIGSTMDLEAKKVYSMATFVLLFVVPILVLGVCYAMIVWRLWTPDRQLVQQPATGKANSFVAKARRKTTIMLVVVFLAFFFCVLPFNLFAIIIDYVGSTNFDLDTIKTAQSVVRTLYILNSATNPIIYNFLSAKFRDGFRHIRTCSWRVGARVGLAMEGETVLT